MIDQAILAQAETTLRQCMAEWPDAQDQHYIYESFSLRFEGSQFATQAMLRLLASLLHERIGGHLPGGFLITNAADPSLNSPADAPSTNHNRVAGEPISATTPLVGTHTDSVAEPSSPTKHSDAFHNQAVGEPPAPAPIQPPRSGNQLARERPKYQNVVTRPLPPQAVNPPRTSLAAIAAANQRLAKSLLDSWMVRGKKFGDCTAKEVLAACDANDRTTRLMRAVVRDLPPDHLIRTVLTAEGAQYRYMTALTEHAGIVIEATQPGGYRHVSN